MVYFFAFDVAHELLLSSVRQLLGQPLSLFSVGASKRSPRQTAFYKAQMVQLPSLERPGEIGSLSINRTLKVLPIGAISITFRVPFEVEHLQDLVAFHDLQYVNGVPLHQDALELAEEARKEMVPYSVRPNPQVGEEEAYTVFCLHTPGAESGGHTSACQEWLAAHRREVASLLNEERDTRILSEQKVEESLARVYSYGRTDIAIIDWDAALVVDTSELIEETLYIIELANLQLAELEAYDRILDHAVDRAYRDLAKRRFARWTGVRTQRELREIRVDLARLQGDLSNITKFFGEWHMALISQGLSSRFHLADWHRSIDEKLKTLDEIYQLLQMDRNNSWMLVLEATIVALFILDIVILLVLRGH